MKDFAAARRNANAAVAQSEYSLSILPGVVCEGAVPQLRPMSRKGEADHPFNLSC